MNKAIFRTAYGEQIRKHAPSGRRYQNEYGYKINAVGQKVLEKKGEIDLYEQIQMSLEETKIENILKRASAGDTTVFRPDGMYMDITQLPNNLIEARQAMQNLENLWGEVPNDIKAKYNYDLDLFISASGSESWLKDMGMLPSEAKAVTETVKEVTNTSENSKKGDLSNE